jgi:hypothetical protein
MDRRPAGPRFRSGEPYEQCGQAAFACSDQRDGFPKRQTLCRITESFLATATFALPLPDRLAMAYRQSFKLGALLSRVRITISASYIRVQRSPAGVVDDANSCYLLRNVQSNKVGHGWTSDDANHRATLPESRHYRPPPIAILGCLHYDRANACFCLITGTFPV